MNMILLLTLSAFGVSPGEEDPPPGPTNSQGVVLLRHCALEYEKTSNMGPPFRGVIQVLSVNRGDMVKAGQVICRLFDEDVRAETALYKAQAASDLEVRVTENRLAKAKNRLKRTQRLHDRQLVSLEDFEEDRLDAEQAKLAVEEAKENLKLAQLRLAKAMADSRGREFICPFDGVVVDLLKYPGESVVEGETVIKLVSAGRLRVTGFLNVTEALRVVVGQPVRVRVEVAGDELPIEREVFEGVVEFVDSQIDPMTRTCKVIAGVPNRGGLLKSGLSATMEILPGPLPPAAQASPSTPAGPPAS